MPRIRETPTKDIPLMHPRNFINKHQLTYQSFADEIGVGVDTVDKWMAGKNKIPLPVQRLCAALDTIAELTQST